MNESATLGQYFIRNSKSLSERFSILDDGDRFSLEMINFILALFILTVRYPAVFWRVNKCFSILFSIHLLLNLSQSLIVMSAFQVTFKIFVCDPTHLMIRYRESSSLSLTQLSFLLFVYIVVLQLSAVTLHFYGMQKYREYRYARTKYLQDKYESSPLSSYLSYLLAMIFFFTLSLLIGPLFYEFVIVYCGSLNICTLLVILSTIVYFTCWIVLWVCLANKTSWTFDYCDFENDDDFLLEKSATPKCFPLIIISQGKVYRIKDDIAKKAIQNYIQDNSYIYEVNHQNDSNLFQDRSRYNRMSVRSVRNERPYTRSLNRASNYRHSTRSYRKANHHDGSDSEGEYTTFGVLSRCNSLKQSVFNWFVFSFKHSQTNIYFCFFFVCFYIEPYSKYL